MACMPRREAAGRIGTSPIVISVFLSAKLGSVGDRKSYLPLTLGQEKYNLEFALLGFSLAFVRCFINKFFLLPFGTVMYILGHCMLEVCGEHFDFCFYGVL